ncbi:MAG TPA: hypothetical protein DD417_07995 [Elusimicrobia bacterium]|nr:hypothetical protein [Elusimicrobiota bacterium]
MWIAGTTVPGHSCPVGPPSWERAVLPSAERAAGTQPPGEADRQASLGPDLPEKEPRRGAQRGLRRPIEERHGPGAGVEGDVVGIHQAEQHRAPAQLQEAPDQLPLRFRRLASPQIGTHHQGVRLAGGGLRPRGVPLRRRGGQDERLGPRVAADQLADERLRLRLEARGRHQHDGQGLFLAQTQGDERSLIPQQGHRRVRNPPD